ncbi:ARH protein, partial [Prunella fulvescens]|nr:ARH protein [Prunella fulvescens]
AKASGKKLQKVTLKVSPRGIVLNDSRTNELIENISIYRWVLGALLALCCSSGLSSSPAWALILSCSLLPQAQAVTLTVAQAFRIAFEFWQAAKEEKEKRERSILAAEGTSSPSSGAPAHPVTAAAMGNLLDLEDPGRSPLQSPELDNSSFGPSPSVNNNVVWEMDDGLDEAFSRLAQSRTNPQVLDTGLTAQDMQSAETLSPVDWNKMEPSPAERDDLFMF